MKQQSFYRLSQVATQVEELEGKDMFHWGAPPTSDKRASQLFYTANLVICFVLASLEAS